MIILIPKTAGRGAACLHFSPFYLKLLLPPGSHPSHSGKLDLQVLSPSLSLLRARTPHLCHHHAWLGVCIFTKLSSALVANAASQTQALESSRSLFSYYSFQCLDSHIRNHICCPEVIVNSEHLSSVFKNLDP